MAHTIKGPIRFPIEGRFSLRLPAFSTIKVVPVGNQLFASGGYPDMEAERKFILIGENAALPDGEEVKEIGSFYCNNQVWLLLESLGNPLED